MLLAPALAALRRAGAEAPQVAIVAGSGLGDVALALEGAVMVPYAEIPGWPTATVPGHAGHLALGHLGDVPVVVACGRAHLYEGYSPRDVTFGVRVLAAAGARTLVIMNAAGALAPGWAPGDTMLIADHIFVPGMVGLSPLVGPVDDGERFPPMAGAYDLELRRVAREALVAQELVVHEGIYAMVAGPSYETPAEARMLRAWGADVVGMSTVPEVVVARALDLRVLGLSVVTNRVLVDSPAPPGDVHREVLGVAQNAAPRLARAVKRIVAASATLDLQRTSDSGH